MNKKIISAILLLTASSQCFGMMAVQYALRGILIKTGVVAGVFGGGYLVSHKDHKLRQKTEKELAQISVAQNQILRQIKALAEQGVAVDPTSVNRHYQAIAELKKLGRIKEVKLKERTGKYTIVELTEKGPTIHCFATTRFPWTVPKINRFVKDPAIEKWHAFNKKRKVRKKERQANRRDKKENRQAGRAFEQLVKRRRREQGQQNQQSNPQDSQSQGKNTE